MLGAGSNESTEAGETEATGIDPREAVGVDVESSMREVNGVHLHTLEAGPRDGPLVVLLHGFPEYWYGWHHQIGTLVDAGYRVLVPDQRGYNTSEKPAGVEPYRLGELSRDVYELVAAAGRASAHVVGHDMGGMVAWDVARRFPETVDRLCVLNCPHYSAYRRTVLTNPSQLSKSWYALFFQLPRLPEWLARRDDFELWVDLLQDSSTPGTFSEFDLACYRTAWRHEDAPRAMVNWYRALARYTIHPEREQVDAPTLLVWGDDDVALVPELADASLEYCTDGRLERFPDAGHFVQHEEPEAVGELLVDHLGD